MRIQWLLQNLNFVHIVFSTMLGIILLALTTSIYKIIINKFIINNSILKIIVVSVLLIIIFGIMLRQPERDRLTAHTSRRGLRDRCSSRAGGMETI